MYAARSISTLKIINRLALVIGNNDYHGKNHLENPVNDATDMAEKLRTMDFNVQECFNQTYEQMKSSLDIFVESIQSNVMVLFYFAGHALQWEVSVLTYICENGHLKIES